MTRSLLQPYDVIIIFITEKPEGIYDLRFSIYDLQFAIYNLQFTIYNPETSLVPHVYLMKNEGGGKLETRNPKLKTRNTKPTLSFSIRELYELVCRV